jgi:chromosome segregation protein
MENKLVNNQERLEIVKIDLESIRSSIEEKKKESLNSKRGIEDITNSRTSIIKNMDGLSLIEEEKVQKLDLLKYEKDEFMKDYYLEQNRLKEINKKLNELEKLKNHWNIKEAKYSVQLENINMRLLEDYELVYDEAIELWIEIEDLNNTYKQTRKLKNQIKELGTVNLGSIEEYKKTKERLEFITKQHDDLQRAKEDLQKVIMDMETKMKEQFLYNFNKIKDSFNQVFAILFDGGKADLVLEDEENILNCGIEIKAQPPGKKLQNLTLLSGGEKSLTAVALLFAILQIKPTPFCILDEIDAALDEANINRYTNYLKSFSDETQFIMITHRKSTMEMADVLYGVTMEEEGISKIISVKLTDNLEGIAS